MTVWKLGEWADHIDRIPPPQKLRTGGEPANVDCLANVAGEVVVGFSDGGIRKLRVRPNQYGEWVGRCEMGVSSLAGMEWEEGWVVSASGTKVQFWNLHEREYDGEDRGEEKPKRRRKKGTKSGETSKADVSAFFADL